MMQSFNWNKDRLLDSYLENAEATCKKVLILFFQSFRFSWNYFLSTFLFVFLKFFFFFNFFQLIFGVSIFSIWISNWLLFLFVFDCSSFKRKDFKLIFFIFYLIFSISCDIISFFCLKKKDFFSLWKSLFFFSTSLLHLKILNFNFSIIFYFFIIENSSLFIFVHSFFCSEN